MSSTIICNSLSNKIVVSSMCIGWHALRPKNISIILMHDQSRRSSLGSLNFGRRCFNSTTLTTLFMANPSIKSLSWLTSPRAASPPTLASQCAKEQPQRCLLSSHEGQKISVLQIFNSMSSNRDNFQMVPSVLDSSSESPYDNPIIKIPSMKKKLAIVFNLINKNV